MLTFLTVVGSIALLFLCAWLILLILMQKPSANAGMGAALGGGAAESAFGGEASSVLTRWTVFGVVSFFFLTLTLSLMQIYRHHHDGNRKELAPIAEDIAETPQSLTQLPTEAEAPKSEVSKVDATKAAASDTSKKVGDSTEANGSKMANVKQKAASPKDSALPDSKTDKASEAGRRQQQ